MNANNARLPMRGIICTLLLSMCCFAGTSASARTIRAREVHVVVQSIDRRAKTLTLMYDQGHGQRKLIWNADTKFLCDWRCVSSDELKEGARATIYYRSPLFGKPFATKVVWSIAADRHEL